MSDGHGLEINLRSNPSENTRELYQALADQFKSVPVIPSKEVRHGFKMNMEEFKDVPDEVRVDADDFPYIRSALIDEAIERGDIEYKQKTDFAVEGEE